jgi:hypothetical protein
MLPRECRAPGIPCALSFKVNVSGEPRAKTRGEIAAVYSDVIASVAKQSIVSRLLLDGLLRYARRRC